MITIELTTPQQAEAVLYLLEQGIELERLKLETHTLTKCDTMDSYLKIMHGEKTTSQLIASSLG